MVKSTELAVRESAERSGARRTPGSGAYIRPWVTTALMVPAGWTAHMMWGDAGLATGMAATAIGATGATLTLYTHWLTRARTWYAHLIATASTGAASAWLTAATVVGTGRPLLDALILGGTGLSTFSNLHTWSKGQGNAESEAAPKLPSWEEVTTKVGLRGTQMRITSATEHRTTGKVKLSPGQTVEELTSRLKALASAYGVASNGVRAVEDDNDASQAEVTIITKDVMRTIVPWPGLNPELTGASIADAPLELGIYEDGEPFTDAVNNRHTLTVGMAGSGKSVYGKCKVVQIAARRDTFVVAIDLAKGKQTLGPVEPAIGWPLLRTNATSSSKSKKEAREVLAAIKRAVGARADYLGEQGLTQWTKDCGLTLLHVLIEEAAELVDVDEIVDLARVARSTGIHLELSLQRASWGNLDTDARANLGDGVCFGVRDSADAAFVLPDRVTDAGAAPERWQKTRPGAAYAVVEEQDQARHTIPVKMYGPPEADPARENELLTPAAESLGDQDAKLDPITREALGKPYADYLAARRGETTPAVAQTVTAAAPEGAEPGQEDDDMEFEFSTPDPDPGLVVDVDAPIEVDGEGFSLPPKKRSKESAEEARAALDAQLAAWADQGSTSFRAPELGKALRTNQGVDRSRSWVIGELQRLEQDERVIHEDDGTWTLVTRELAAA